MEVISEVCFGTNFLLTIYIPPKIPLFICLSNVDIMKVVEDDSCASNSSNTTCFRLTSFDIMVPIL